MLYSTLIFIIAFLPLFTMKGVEGVIFSPMSHTYAFALTTAIILAVTLTPVLSSYLLQERDEGDPQHRLEGVSPLLSQSVCQGPALAPSDAWQ